MKRRYESPMMYVEEFVANRAIAACTVEGGINWTFDCMAGPDVDTESVIADNVVSGCDNKIGYAPGISVARDYSRSYEKRHSNNNPSRATWGGTSQYLQVSYTGAQGILYTDYCDETKDKTVWSVTDGYVKHSKQGGGKHHMVAPVIDTTSVNASW